MYQRTFVVGIVLDTVIAYGNRGKYGNILIFGKENKFPTYSLTINNLVSTHAQGAALSIYVADYTYLEQPCNGSPLMINLTIIISNSEFTYNQNGKLKHKKQVNVELEFVGAKFTSTVVIKSTTISHNIGAGLELRHLIYDHKSQVFVILSNVTANNNSLPYVPKHGNSIASRASFVITAIRVTSLVLNNVTITSNNMTGLYVYNTIIMVNGTTLFHNNTAVNGGGMAMYRDSFFIITKHSFLIFTNNKARKNGGAIFVESQLAETQCFFQYIDFTKSVKVIFINNSATAGTVLFGGNIQHCHINIRHHYFHQTFNYSTQTGPSVISSEPTDVCFCDDNNTINCSQTQLTIKAYPGEEINISVVTVGQLNGTAPGILQIKPLDNTDSSAVTELHNTSAMTCTTIALKPIYRTYSLSVFGTESYRVLNVTFSDCPLGFEMLNKTKSCDCEKLKQMTNSITCDATMNMIKRQGDVWIGNISDYVIVHTPCPFDYCNTAQVSFSLNDPDPQCALNRTGILCGKCQDGLSLALGSNNCIRCPQFSYLALIIPFAAAGFGLVALLMVLNLTVSIGTINGLIFYASIVKISESNGIFFRNGSILVLSQFIAWLNLDLGIETCFYHGMTAYAKVWLQFVFPLYIWFIIATIIVLCRYSTWLSNKIGGNVVQVLATLILLSFTKIFRTFAPALTWIHLPSKHTVWYVDGNVPYFSPEHYILMTAAVLFLLLAVPYVFALLFDAVIEKHFTKFSVFRRQWIKLKPFVDAYHGPYKDNCRFWTGLLLLVRMSFTLVSLHLDTFGTLIFITASTTVLLSLLVHFEGVYRKRYLNSLESLSLLNLGLLSGLAAVYQNDSNSEQVVTIISLTVALITFIGVIFLHVFFHFRHNFVKRQNVGESKSLLKDEESSNDKQLNEPTYSEVFMRRESLIY